MEKQGDYKWGIMLSLLIGLMILAVGFSLFYQEAQTGALGDMTVCRESIQARSVLPDAKLGGITFDSFKDAYPLKCKTMVVDVSEADLKDGSYRDKIGGAMAECWALYGKGDSNAFPARFFKTSTCVPCARVHLSDDAKDYMKRENMKINLRNVLDAKMGKDYSYWSYLLGAGERFSAFGIQRSFVSNFSGNIFSIIRKHTIQRNILIHPNKIDKSEVIVKVANLTLPKYFYSGKGDLLIGYGVSQANGKDRFSDYFPYLFYFQVNQEPSPFDEVGKDLFDGMKFCDKWEGIPA